MATDRERLIELEELEELDILRSRVSETPKTNTGLPSSFDKFSELLSPRPSAPRSEPLPSSFDQFSNLIGQPTQEGSPADVMNQIDKFAASKPSKHQELGPLINLLKETIRFPKEQILDPVLAPAGKSLTTGGPSDLVDALKGTARTAEGISRFIPAVGRDVINVTGAGIPTPPLIGEQATEENFKRPTAKEAEEKLRDAPLGLTLGALGLSRIGKAKPPAIESTVKAAAKSKAFKKAVPLAEVSKAKTLTPTPIVPKQEKATPVKPMEVSAPVTELTRKEFIDTHGKKGVTASSWINKFPRGKPGFSTEVPKSGSGQPIPDVASVVFRSKQGKVVGELQIPLLGEGKQQIAKFGKSKINPDGVVQVFVQPEYRNKGIASKLFDIADKQGYDLTELSGTTSSTTRAGAGLFYKRNFQRSTQDLKPETPEISYAKALDNTLKQDVYAKPEKATDLYPLVKESQVYPKSKKFKPATDAQLQTFAQAGEEQWGGLTKPEKSIVRKEYSRQRRLQKNEMEQDARNRLEFGIEPDPVLREKLKVKPPKVEDLSELRDVNVIETTVIPKDPERMIEKTLPKKIGDDLIGRRDKAKAEYTDWVIDRETKHVEFTDKIDIKPGSKLDKATQLFGEGELSVEQITKQFGAKGAEKVAKAAQWYREQYEGLLKEYNSSMANIFPGDRSKLVSRRKDYFRHFRELGDMSRLLDIVEEPGGLLNAPSNVLGFLKSEGKKPGFIRRRLGKKTDISASAGYAEYLQQAGYGINITPMTQYWRRFANQLDASALAGKNEIPRFRSQLHTTINNMTGMPNAIDAWFSEHLGKGWDVMQIANRRAKQNIILGNVGSVLAQPFNIPQALAKMGSPSFAKGASFTLGDIFTKGELSRPMKMDAWMRERYISSKFDRYKVGMINKARTSASWAMRTADKISTEMIWNGFYEEALSKNIKNPVEYARKNTRKSVAGRGIGELPNLQQTKAFQSIAPFTVEVGNAAWAFLELKNGKGKFNKYATYVVGSYLMNRVAENVRGTPVSFDPLQALIEGVKAAADEDKSVGERLTAIPGRLAGEAISATPIGQIIGGVAYPKYGMTIPGTDIKLPTRKEIFGSNDPTRYGNTVLAIDAMDDFWSRLALPFGGVQLKKTLSGIKALEEENITIGNKNIDVERTPENVLKALTFGKYATDEAKDFFDEK